MFRRICVYTLELVFPKLNSQNMKITEVIERNMKKVLQVLLNTLQLFILIISNFIRNSGQNEGHPIKIYFQ